VVKLARKRPNYVETSLKIVNNQKNSLKLKKTEKKVLKLPEANGRAEKERENVNMYISHKPSERKRLVAREKNRLNFKFKIFACRMSRRMRLAHPLRVACYSARRLTPGMQHAQSHATRRELPVELSTNATTVNIQTNSSAIITKHW
jgi:hypothetical protein